MIVITKATYSPIPLKFKILPEKSYTNLGIKFYSISPSQSELFISNNEKNAIKMVIQSVRSDYQDIFHKRVYTRIVL